ncbi:conserved hypothetical protein related to flagellar biosynthesis [Symbiobacterium thermophilum IAM 14863]|uniref:PilZ domain-containing protein n=1 Tax=Symbiobacterium thermophilum (strain DSM 24528 / JCM 14929 / IAM 14863 / T) TaxID=292459 RepID=Q67PC2_SYMTH|nr:conserved hypothetical protein related to flagellar biosynthesis [Symbiobacterium thermophilum IAM 14863]
MQSHSRWRGAGPLRLPTINQQLTIYIPTGWWKGRYSTYLEALEDSTIRVAHPMFGSALIPLMPGDEVMVEYVYNGERVGFAAQVLQRVTEETPALILTRPGPGDIRRQQLRNFVRLDISLPIEYAPGGRKAGEEEPELLPGRTVNISGGGALIVTGESYPPGTRLDLVLHLPDRVIPVEAEVVRHVPVAVVPGSGDPVQTRLGVRFTQIEERDREQIIRFIFAEHRRRRRKGLE